MINMLKFIKGDATSPQAKGMKILPHIVNTENKWGRGYVLAISKRWKQPEIEYHKWASGNGLQGVPFALGSVQFIKVEPYVIVANMIAQKGIKTGSSGPPIRYDALITCLKKVLAEAVKLGASIHMPWVGCGLAGGSKNKIQSILQDIFGDSKILAIVYSI